MPQLDLLISPPGTGKTTFCVDRFREEIQKSHSGIDSRSFFVLPSREHADRIQNLLLRKNVAGFFNAHVLTLNDLTALYSDGSGLTSPPDSIRSTVVRSMLNQQAEAGNLSFFSRVADAKGFARALSSFFSEMRRGLVTVQDFERYCQPLLADPVFRLKFRDVSMLVKSYEAAIRQRGFAEPEERLKALQIGSGAAHLVIFDGFYSFTRSQLALVEALTHGAGRILVTLTAPADAADRPHVFAHALRTRRDLEAIGFRAGTTFFKDSRRTSSPALRHLTQALFLPQPDRLVSTNLPQILEAPNAREEMRGIAREIRRFYRTGSFHWSDCAVILRAVEPYRKILESAFAEFEVPVHIHERRRLIEQGLAQTAARLLRLIRDDWRHADAAFTIRSSSRIGKNQAQAALELVRTARAAGIVDGRSFWEAFATDPKLEPSSKAVLEQLLRDEERLRSARSAPELSRRLRAWLRTLDSDEDVLVREALEEIFERLGRIEESAGPFSVVRASEELIDSIEAGLFSEKPRGRNRVQVYDVVMALPKEYKAVFISGLAEKQFPREATEEPILKDVERRMVNERAGRTVFEERSLRLSGERYFFYIAATRARELLMFTYPSAGLDGRPVLPSIFIEDVRRCFVEDAMPVRRTTGESGPDFWEGEREAATGILVEAFSPMPAESQEALSRITAWTRNDAFRTAFLAGLRDPSARLENAANRARLASDKRPFSASSLEALVACRFKYFSSKLLKLNALPEDRAAAEQGIVFHATLEAFYKSLTDTERSDPKAWVNPAEISLRLQPHLEKAFSENSYFRRVPAHGRAILLAQMKRALMRFSREEVQLRRDRPFIPAYFEQEFGVTKPFFIGELPVRGVIDRIDLSNDGKTALVVDYKSSKTNFVSKIRKGLELQMPIYWMAVEKMLGVRVVGVEHRHLKDGNKPERRVLEEFKELFGNSKAWSEEEAAAVLEKVREDAQEAVRALRSADIAVRPKTCDHCDYSPVCRFEKWKLIYREQA